MTHRNEAHLFIIWKNARCKQEEILSEIASCLRVVEVFEVEWSENKYSSNLTRFYGQNLPDRSFKEKHCGKGPFILIICEDKNPTYNERDTISRDIEKVNSNIFDLKQKFRAMTGGGHKIHATNNPTETNHDLALLLATNYNDYDIGSRPTWNGEIVNIKQDLVGHSGWSSLSELFYILNACEEYVVLRNFEGLPDQSTLEGHDDIDFLVKNYTNFVYLLNGKKVFDKKYRVHFELLIANSKVLCDIRYIGDNYLDIKWQRNILYSRELLRGFYVPNKENHVYSVLYHALVQKKIIADNYLEILEKFFKTIEIDLLENKLLKFLHEHDYSFVEPEDLTVYYNRNKQSLLRKLFYSYLRLRMFLRKILK